MRRFRSEPQDIEAVQWTGDNLSEVREFGGRRIQERCTAGCQVYVRTRDFGDWAPVPRLSWIVRAASKVGSTNNDGPYYIVDPDYFSAVFEEYERLASDDDKGAHMRHEISENDEATVVDILSRAGLPQAHVLNNIRIAYQGHGDDGRPVYYTVDFKRPYGSNNLAVASLAYREIPWD